MRLRPLILPLKLSLVIFLLSCFSQCLADTANTALAYSGTVYRNLSPKEELLQIDQGILLECIELARFNIRFHQAANEHWPWRAWLYPLAQAGAASCSLANNVVDLSQRANALDDHTRLSRSALRKGLASAITGNAVGGASSALELTQNLLVIALARRKGYSPKNSLKTVKNHLQTIDDLLRRRENLIATGSFPEPERKIRKIETSLMERIRDQLVFEFRKWSASSREFMWQENTYFTIDTLQNFTQMTSGILSVRGFQEPSLRGAAGISAMVANSTAAVNPAVSALVAHMVRSQQRARLAKQIPYGYWDPNTHPNAEWLEAQKLIANPADETSVKEVAFLIKNSGRFDYALEAEGKAINKLRRVADQQAIAAPIIQTASLAQSLCSTIAYYDYRDDPLTSNRLSFAGRISKTAGQSYSLMATISARVRKTIYESRLRKEGRLPEQVFRQRLIVLDKLESQVRAANY